MATTPTFVNFIRSIIREELAGINTCAPGSVVSYNVSEMSATVISDIPRKFSDGTESANPVISGVPVLWPRWGGGIFAGHLVPGDKVLLVFSQRSLDSYLLGKKQAPDSERKFHLSDAIAIPGVYPLGPSLAESGAAVIKHNGGAVRLGQDGRVEAVAASGAAFAAGSDGSLDLATSGVVSGGQGGFRATAMPDGSLVIVAGSGATVTISASGDIFIGTPKGVTVQADGDVNIVAEHVATRGRTTITSVTGNDELLNEIKLLLSELIAMADTMPPGGIVETGYTAFVTAFQARKTTLETIRNSVSNIIG